MTKERLRILILWTHISGYMAANWRALAQHDDIQVSAIAWSTDPARNHADFPKEEITGVDLHFVDETDDSLEEIARQRLHAYQPQVVLVAGWGVKAYRRVLRQCSQENPKAIRWKTVMGMDTVWRGSWKQRFARPLLSDYLKRIDAVLVAGPGAKIYAQRLGFPEGSIHRGLYLRERKLDWSSLCLRESPISTPESSNIQVNS